jgi:hypothetical protein
MKMFFRDVRAQKRRALLEDLNSIARKEIEKVLDEEVKPTLVLSHEIIVADWKHKPGFGSKKFIEPDQMRVYVFPTGEHAQESALAEIQGGRVRAQDPGQTGADGIERRLRAQSAVGDHEKSVASRQRGQGILQTNRRGHLTGLQERDRKRLSAHSRQGLRIGGECQWPSIKYWY